MTKPGIILQARLTSKRFPNKVLCPLLGKPILQWCIEAIEKTNIPYVIAIPDTMPNQGLSMWIREYCINTEKDIVMYLGSEEDLVARFIGAADIMKFDPIIRMCADNPFIKPEEFEDIMYMWNKYHCYQRVNHLEVFSRKELEYVEKNDSFIARREHCVLMLTQTVDYPEDIKRLEEEYNKTHQTISASKNAEINPEGFQFGET